MIDCETSRTQLRYLLHLVRRTAADRMAAHRKSDRRRDDLSAGGLHKYGHMSRNCHESKVGGGDDATGRRSEGMVQAGVVVGQDITGACEFKDLVAWSG